MTSASCALASHRSGPGTTFLAGGSNGTLAWYDAATASLLGEASLGGRSASNCTASAPSGPVPTCVASSPGKAITVWRLNAPGGASADSSDALELVASADAVKGERVSGVDISADARLVVTASKETFVRLWDVERGMAPSGRASASRNTATCVKLFPGSTIGRALVAQGSEDLRVRLWDVRSPSAAVATTGTMHMCTCSLALAGYVYFPLSIDIHPNGRHILTSSRGVSGLGGEARVWDVRMPSAPLEVAAAAAEATELFSAPVVSPAAVDSPRLGPGVQVAVYSGHDADAGGCAWMPPAAALASGIPGSFATASTDCTVRLWQPRPDSDGTRHADSDESAECIFRHVDSASLGFTQLCWLGDSMASSAVVTSSDGSLRVLEVSPEGRLAMTAELADEPDEASE